MFLSVTTFLLRTVFFVKSFVRARAFQYRCQLTSFLLKDNFRFLFKTNICFVDCVPQTLGLFHLFKCLYVLSVLMGGEYR